MKLDPVVRLLHCFISADGGVPPCLFPASGVTFILTRVNMQRKAAVSVEEDVSISFTSNVFGFVCIFVGLRLSGL